MYIDLDKIQIKYSKNKLVDLLSIRKNCVDGTELFFYDLPTNTFKKVEVITKYRLIS